MGLWFHLVVQVSPSFLTQVSTYLHALGGHLTKRHPPHLTTDLEKPLYEENVFTALRGAPPPPSPILPCYLHPHFTRSPTQSLRSVWFPMECDLPHGLTSCPHFAFLSYQRLGMPVCTINQWHFKLSLWPQLLSILVQLAVLIMFMTSPKFLMLYFSAKRWDILWKCGF